jgi:16S rRNA G1207 methylase RsmC
MNMLCKHCDKNFLGKTSSALRSHQSRCSVNPTKVKHYCETCSRGFASAQGLKGHTVLNSCVKIEGVYAPFPEGKFDVVLMDPPFRYANNGQQTPGVASKHYPVLSLKELKVGQVP